MSRHLLLIDTNHLVSRAAFTGADPVRMIRGLIRRHSPTHMVLCRDSHWETFRRTLCPLYKANRYGREGPSSNDRVDEVQERFTAEGWCIASAPGAEGDDICATLARRAVLADTRVTVVSGDKDLWQLADWATVVYPIPGGERVMDARAVFDALGVWSHQIPTLKALAGEKGDNIPRILRPERGGGFTEKRVVELLAGHACLNEIYYVAENNPNGPFSAKEREWLEAGRERAYLNLRLATLREDVPLEVDPRSSRL
jgi:5'-3' exonuclease